MGWFLLVAGVGFLSVSLVGELFGKDVRRKEARNLGGTLLLVGVGIFMLASLISPLDEDFQKYCVVGVGLLTQKD